MSIPVLTAVEGLCLLQPERKTWLWMDADFQLRKPEDGLEADIAQALNGNGFKADANPLFSLRRRKYCVIILNAMPVNTKKYLDAEGLSYFWEKIKTYVGEAIESGTSDIANKLHFVVPNEKESTEALTANVSGIDALSPGLVVALRMPFDNTASQTLNINSLGAKPIYYQSDSADAGKFPEGSVALLVYETESVATGCFKAVYSYDDNGPDIDDLVKDITLAKRTSMNVGFMVLDNKQFSLHYPRTSSEFSETVRYYYSMGMRFKDYTFPFDGTTVVELAALASLPETFQLILAFIVNPEETQDYLKYAPAMSEMTELADVDAAIQADGRYTVVLPFNNSSIRRADGYFEITKPEDSYVIKARLEFGETIQNVIDQTTEYADGSTKESVVVLTDVVPAKHTHSFEDLIIDVYQGATENANGVAGLVPSALSEEKDRFLKGDGTWASTNIDLSLEHVPAGTKTVSVPYSPEAAEMGLSNDGEDFKLKTLISIDNETVYNENKTHPVGNISLDCSSLNINDDSVINVALKATSGGGDFWLRYTLEANFNDLISAGTEGMPLTEDTSNSEGYSPLPENKEFRISLTDEGNGQYSLYPFIAENQSVPTKYNLVVEQPDGTSGSVDLNPLIDHIGGTIEDLPDENGAIYALPLQGDDNEVTSGPVYEAFELMYTDDVQVFVDSSGNTIRPSSWTFDETSVTLEFEDSIPVTMRPEFGYKTDAQDLSYIKKYATSLDETTEEPESISVADALAAASGIKLLEYNLDPQTLNPSLAEDQSDSVYMMVEKIADEPYSLRFQICKRETKPMLRLHPSENGSIDLSGLTAENVVKVYTEVEPHTKTEESIETVTYNGSIRPYSSQDWFYIGFGFSDASTNPPTYSAEFIEVTKDLSSIINGQDYTFNFTVNGTPEAIALSVDWYVTDNNGQTNNLGYWIIPDSSIEDNTTAVSAGYEAWEGNDNTRSLIKMNFPIGVKRDIFFNGKMNYNYYNSDSSTHSVYNLPFSKLGMIVSITNVDGTNYILTFRWDYSETITTEVTTNWKELKTTIERKNGTNTIERRIAAGFLQNASLSKESSYVIEETSAIDGIYHPYICINDSGLEVS